MRLLNIVFEDIFLTYFHGFRKGRGVITFFAHVPKLGKVDRLIQADIVGCFKNLFFFHIPIFTLRAHIGQGNDAFCNLIEATDIKDKNRKSYAFIEKGIQRGSPLSPVLMNIFLHKQIMFFHIFSQKKEFWYVRYADDLLFAIKKGPESERVSQSFQQMFQESLAELKLFSKSLELIREVSKPCYTLVLGVLVLIHSNGILLMK